MPHYLVTIHGSGIRMPVADTGHEIAGFFTNRIVRAASFAAAESRACELVAARFAAERFQGLDPSAPLRLEAVRIKRSSFLARLRFRATGFSFYGTYGKGGAEGAAQDRGPRYFELKRG